MTQLSPEVIGGYQWHPTPHGLYLQPWMGFGVVAWQSGKAVVGARTYSALPVSPFFTVNVGWECPKRLLAQAWWAPALVVARSGRRPPAKQVAWQRVVAARGQRGRWTSENQLPESSFSIASRP